MRRGGEGEWSLVKLALEVERRTQREGGLAVELGLAAQRHIGGLQVQVADPVLATVAAQAGGDGAGQRLAVEMELPEAEPADRETDRQLQVAGQHGWRGAGWLGDGQRVDGEFGDAQFAPEQGGRRPVEADAAGLDLPVGPLPAQAGDAQRADQPAARLFELHLAAAGTPRQVEGTVQAAVAGGQPGGTAEERGAGEQREGKGAAPHVRTG